MSGEKRHRGRPFDTSLAEELSVTHLLGRPGAQGSISDIASALLVTNERAQTLVDKLTSELVTAHDEVLGPALPVYTSGTHEHLCLLPASGATTTTHLRLTEAQAQALLTAWRRLGIDPSDSRPSSLADSFFPLEMTHGEGVDDAGQAAADIPDDASAAAGEDTKPAPVAQAHPTSLGALEVCASSIATAQPCETDDDLIWQTPIEFRYQGENDLIARGRRAVPRHLYLTDEGFAADCHDLDARATRTFLLPRMRDVRLAHKSEQAPVALGVNSNIETYVRVLCTEDGARTVRSWNGARAAGIEDGLEAFDVPYFRGDWLPRNLMALGDKARCDNPDLREEMRAIAEEDLAMVCTLPTRERSATS